MKRPLVSLIACTLLFCTLALTCESGADEDRAIPPIPLTVNIGTYNIHGGLSSSGASMLDRIANDIASADLDIVALQEVDYRTKRNGGADQASFLAETLGMNAAFGPTKKLMSGGRFGNAVLTHMEIVSHRNIRLPGNIFRVGRKVLEVTVRDPSTGVQLIILATHFSLFGDDRKLSADWINRSYGKHVMPVFLAADLNESPSGSVVRILSDTWANATEDLELATYPARDPKTQIDFLFARPEKQVQFRNPKIRHESASDHLLLSATVTVSPAD